MISIRHQYFSRFDGISFKNESSSKFSHKWVYALGSYQNSPFVTGSGDEKDGGLKTEILKKTKWTVVTDYPFAKPKFIKN